MRSLKLATIALCFICAEAVSQSSTQDEALLAKTRALYDAPFTRDLVSFDCAVQFDWKQHFIDALGSLPVAATPTVNLLQTVQHRIFVDRSSAVLSSIPKVPNLSSAPHATDFEKVFDAMIPAGLTAWLPSSTNVLLPVEPTKFNFEKLDSGYKLTMNGSGVAAKLLLASDFRLTSGIAELPQPMRFTTAFTSGPNGFLLTSVKTGDTTDPSMSKEAQFAYTYQTVEEFQLPSEVTITPPAGEVWHFMLRDCKTMKGANIKVGLRYK